ncbi:MAG: hypothetical protein JWM91_4444 [Rhodospirillales bacterium]|nr:hypothetical protein [Rhodospirillales bacterium]
MYRSLAVAFTLALCGCSSTVSTLQYTPTGPVQVVSAPTVGAVTATDRRKEAPNRLATIMGGFGNPLKTLDTAKPVKDEVADAFLEGLRVRGLLAPNDQAPFRLALVTRKFDSDQYIGRGARIDLRMSVVDRAGRTVFEDSATDEESEAAFAESGIFGKIEALQRLCEVVLDRSVDHLLDSPGFRAAVSRLSDAGS